MTRHSHAPRHSAAGFTLVELLIAMVIAGFLAGVILQVVTGQARFTDVQYARQEVQDNARGTLELVGSELRGVPLPGGLIHASEDSIRFAAPVIWGVYCGAAGGSHFAIFDKGAWVNGAASIPASPGLAVQTAELNATAGTVAAFQFSGSVTRSDTLNAAGAAASPCGTLTSAPTQTSVVKIDGVAAGVTPVAGLAVYLYRTVAYGDGLPVTSGDRWMTRENGGQPEPLAGPIEYVAFRYLDAAGATVASGDLNAVRSVRVVVAMKARKMSGASTFVTSEDSITVALRNFQ
jgi:prepilin-type N-terminal cleavage/methylation domain-containing protein